MPLCRREMGRPATSQHTSLSHGHGASLTAGAGHFKAHTEPASGWLTEASGGRLRADAQPTLAIMPRPLAAPGKQGIEKLQ
jgi:hypothetical protein